MPSKRLLMTSAPFCLLALAGMGLATAQSSSPFAPQKRAQAWEQAPAVRSAPQSWSAPAAPSSTSQNSSAPYQALRSAAAPQLAYSPPPVRSSYSEAAIPVSSDAPISTTRRRATAMPTYSAQTPPKTFGGGPAAPARKAYAPQSAYSAQKMAGAAPTPPVNKYAQKFAQAPDLGSPTPPSGQARPTAPSGSPYAPGSSRRVQAWETPPPASAPQVPTYQAPQYQSPQAPAPQYQGQPYPAQTYGAPSPATPPATYGQHPPTGYAPNSYSQPAYQSSVPPTGAPYPGGPYGQGPQAPRSWTEKLGLKNLATLFRGKLTLGGAATYRDVPDNQLGPNDGWSDDEIADAELEFEVSAITDGGLEYGVALGAL